MVPTKVTSLTCRKVDADPKKSLKKTNKLGTFEEVLDALPEPSLYFHYYPCLQMKRGQKFVVKTERGPGQM